MVDADRIVPTTNPRKNSNIPSRLTIFITIVDIPIRSGVMHLTFQEVLSSRHHHV